MDYFKFVIKQKTRKLSNRYYEFEQKIKIFNSDQEIKNKVLLSKI